MDLVLVVLLHRQDLLTVEFCSERARGVGVLGLLGGEQLHPKLLELPLMLSADVLELLVLPVEEIRYQLLLPSNLLHEVRGFRQLGNGK